MDIDFFDELQEEMPKFNQKILDGLAYSGLKRAKEDVDNLIRCAEKSFPPGFEYIDSKICSPQKTYRVMSNSLTRSDRSGASVDLAPSNTYLVEYHFTFEGKPLYPRYFFLPYARKGGLITIVGKEFALSPVLADPCFSIGEDHVFIRTNRSPVTFKQVMTHFMVDGVPESRYVACSSLHHKGGGNDKRRESDVIQVGKVATTMPHYLFCRYGVLETFRKFARCDVIITNEQEQLENPLDKDKYVFISSTKIIPTWLKINFDYKHIASPIILAIPKNCYNALTLRLAGGFFYILDYFPEMTDIQELGGSWQWKVWLGHVLWGDQLGSHKLIENVEYHLDSLGEYVDIECRQRLMDEEGLDIQDIYELFVYIIVEIESMVSKSESELASMFGKRLIVAPYVLRDIYEQIFRCMFEIINNRKRKHTADDYNKILGKYFSPAKIFELRKTSQKAYVTSVSTPGDNMFFKITSRLVMQARTSSGSRTQNLNVNDPMCWLHSSTAIAGNYGLLPKNCPLARNTINPTALLDEKDTILEKEHAKALERRIAEVIKRD